MRLASLACATLFVASAAAQQAADPTLVPGSALPTFRAAVAPVGGWLGVASDDFNRANGALGPNWSTQVGSFGVVNSRCAGLGSGNQWTRNVGAGPNTATTRMDLDFFPGASAGLNYVACVLGDGTTSGGLFIKVQGSGGTFTQFGMYSGFNGGGWGGIGSGFFNLVTPTASGHMSVYLTNAGDSVVLDIDNNFDGIVDESHLAQGVNSVGGITIAPGAGIGIFGEGIADNFEVRECPVIEGFEHNNPALWTTASGGPIVIQAASAHDGARGAFADDGSWNYRSSIVTSPGNSYRWYVRRGAGLGRTYCGVAAGAGGAFTAVYASNTGNIILQDNTGYGFSDLASAAFVGTPGVWYQLELNWTVSGYMTVSIYDEAGTSRLATTGPAATGAVTSGGLALRGFGHSGDVDTIRRCPGYDCTTLESFEHNNPALWTNASGGPVVIQTASAHDGARGAFADNSGWNYRTDTVTYPGNAYRWRVRHAGTSGRTYCGVAASAGGAYCAVYATNTANIILQDNTGYGFVDLATAPFNAAPGTWYQLELAWAANGNMTVSIYDDAGTVRLASTGAVATGVVTPGGLALRGFGHAGDVDTIENCGKPEGPTIYCTAKVNSLGCLPAIGYGGTPSATAASGFKVTCLNVRNQKFGLLFYSLAGPASSPFQCGTLCVSTPIRRTPAQSSGGTPLPANNCTGVYALDMNCFTQGGCGGNPVAGLKVPGTVVYCQWFSRDQGFAAPCNTGLSDALQYTQGI